MEEKVLQKKKNGMTMLVFLALGWIPFCGLTVLKPQEAVVLCGNRDAQPIVNSGSLY